MNYKQIIHEFCAKATMKLQCQMKPVVKLGMSLNNTQRSSFVQEFAIYNEPPLDAQTLSEQKNLQTPTTTLHGFQFSSKTALSFQVASKTDHQLRFATKKYFY